jgi:hypothetical protein
LSIRPGGRKTACAKPDFHHKLPPNLLDNPVENGDNWLIKKNLLDNPVENGDRVVKKLKIATIMARVGLWPALRRTSGPALRFWRRVEPGAAGGLRLMVLPRRRRRRICFCG